MTGLSAKVNLAAAQGESDLLQIRMRGGVDSVFANSLAAGSVRLFLDGGDGDDVLSGSLGDDFLDGGAGVRA